ncbi:DUF4157 domain-containing protein [Dyella tabacisoli]|uniref:eCIS core domain-containing protein n=1 Tax=Dyella tabacisoli TaxID=2282381 RepID=UPI001CDD369C|nr:DUF4157 domain-containing protein [Dyella tabacisoli]
MVSGSAPAAEVIAPTPAIPAGVTAALAGNGRPLDPAARAFFEPRLQHDFAQVRIHDDASAAQSAESLNANAYTLGHRIAFAAGAYAPHTTQGRALLAHELAHVTQSAQLGPQMLMRDPTPPIAVANRFWDAGKIKQRVQALDTTPNKEISKLAQGSDLYGNQTLAWSSRPTGGTKTDWQINISFDKTLDPSGSIRGSTITTDVSAATATAPAVKLITIRLNPDAKPTPEEVTLLQPLKDDKERRHRTVAVTLLHELMHARIAIGRVADASGSTPASDTLDSLDKAKQQSITTASAERATIVGQVVALVKFGDKTLRAAATTASPYTTPTIIDTDAKIRAFANATPDDMVEEKFAKQRSSTAEGLKTVTNNVIADAYGDKVDRTIRSLFPQPNSLGTIQLFTNEVQNLKTMLEKFFDAIDKPAGTPSTPSTSGSANPPPPPTASGRSATPP